MHRRLSLIHAWVVLNSVRELFLSVPQRVDAPLALPLLQGAVQFEITGPDGGSYYVDQQPTGLICAQGRHPSPASTLTTDAECLWGMWRYELHWFEQLRTGRVKATGAPVIDMGVVLFGSERFYRAQQLAAEKVRRRPRAKAIERVSGATPSDIRRAVDESRPLLLTDGFDSYRQWSLDGLVQRHGDVVVALQDRRNVPLRQLVAAIKGLVPGDDKALTSPAPLDARLHDGLEYPRFVDPAEVSIVKMFLGAKGTGGGGLHCDTLDGLTVHLIGRKRFLFFSPDQAPLLYPRPVFNMFQSSRVDPWAPNLAALPKFAQAEGFEVIVGPGETLFIPAWWYHCVTALEPALSIRFDLLPRGAAAEGWPASTYFVNPENSYMQALHASP